MTGKIDFLDDFNRLARLKTKGTNFSENRLFFVFSRFFRTTKKWANLVFQSNKTTQKHSQIVIFDVKFATDHEPVVSFSIFFTENWKNQKNLEKDSNEKLSIIAEIGSFVNFSWQIWKN